MDADSPVDPDDPGTVQWRRDATTSRTLRLLWSFGVGTLFAMVLIIAVWRLYDIAGQAGDVFQAVILAAVAATIVTILAVVLSSNSAAQLERLLAPLPVPMPDHSGLDRVLNAALGTVIMAVFIATLMVMGRIAAQPEFLGAGGESPFTGLAAATIPLALIGLALASFLHSVGAFDRKDETIYLYDPDQAIDLADINAVSSRTVGDTAILTLEYAQPDGQYVAGPRRIVVPPAVADDVRSTVDARRLRFSEKVRQRIRGWLPSRFRSS
ncbi:hypothetical protein [Natronolimnobius baerhuensis]|uniref:Uncharacterized protein n=1 Tax=Natronolimnobius baerhuensis TaxID=253108 RepID=A0A202E5X5_9EURY|nr:hypothetical protein [Natronolimnobius baerhuensis]OVE83676.1 hypothetical protein B2G88_14710 [Natronolimnobius baerhuensis]